MGCQQSIMIDEEMKAMYGWQPNLNRMNLDRDHVLMTGSDLRGVKAGIGGAIASIPFDFLLGVPARVFGLNNLVRHDADHGAACTGALRK